MSVRSYPNVPRIYLDMDGVIADFEASCKLLDVHPQRGKLLPGIYRSLPVIPGAVEGVNELLRLGFFVMCLTKIPSKNPGSASEKILWLNEHFPVLKDYIIITPDKGCAGTNRDYLVDDHPEWANASAFPGTIIHFGTESYKNWDQLIMSFRVLSTIRPSLI